MREIDADNTPSMRDILARYGWPGVTLVGDDGAHAAWYLLQHAPPDFQEWCLPHIAVAAAIGEARPKDLAYLVDRILTHQGRPQLYGTQYDGATMTPLPIERPEHLDWRRAQVGLEPHAEYHATICGPALGSVSPGEK
ncbi:DUF6624 domain-containing protein [Thermomonospora umbrina]|uniref:DUF6624 domain-containing protein n=1 Tax=Thermomonospora umbrina TaxID=111806 RepID=UPI001B87509F|nr:DUF6624 domain-containing protein [Thermomonospora umbrina]